MNKKQYLLPVMAFVVLVGLQLSSINSFAQAPGAGGPGGANRPAGAPGAGGPGGGGGFGGGGRRPLPPIPLAEDTTHTLTKHFIEATPGKKAPDARGFIQRWLVLEPVKNNLRSNSTITESYLKNAFATQNFSQDYNAIPKNGETVKIGDQQLKWRAIDTKAFNFNLYNFSYATNTTRAGVLFWLVTVIDCPQEIKNIRLAAGVNSGGAFWLNGKEILTVPGDKDIIVDNVASPLITLNKGRNVLRAAIINGQGMCNFVARFLDENGQPVKNFTLSNQ
ncbi:MAG: acetylxylan esterase [Sphingobacteriaceae bacterium]|nr:MAG: acetylxylan esterase [Sphingobacteriaceae bacterium]